MLSSILPNSFIRLIYQYHNSHDTSIWWFLLYYVVLMSSFQWISLAIAIMWWIGMNLAMKYTAQIPAFLVYAIAFGTAMIVSLIIAWSTGQRNGLSSLSSSQRYLIIGLWISFVILNVGFLWLYSSGLSVAYIPVAVTAGQTIGLIAISLLILREPLSRQTWVGAILILSGLIVMSWK